MSQAARLNLRMQKELKLLLTDAPHGASFPLLSSLDPPASLTTIHALIEGPEGTVYDKGVFKINIQIPERYPFQPPVVTFATPIYHPNIDTGGRICLDILNLPPKGAWQPSLNISTVITSIRLLLSEPNPDDGLMCEASKEYKYNRQVFDQKARAMTEKYAKSRSNCSNHCTATNSDMSMAHNEVEEVPEDIKYDVISSHQKPCLTSRKLSLEPPSSKNKRDGENHSPQFDACLASKVEKKELIDTPEDYNLRNEKLHRRKRAHDLAYESSIHSNGAQDDGVNVKLKHQSSLNDTECSKKFDGKSAQKNLVSANASERNIMPSSFGKKLSLRHITLSLQENAGTCHELSVANSSFEKQQCKENYDENGVDWIAQLGNELQADDSIIVLDSEDSDEEEGSGSTRSKFRLGKRKLV